MSKQTRLVRAVLTVLGLLVLVACGGGTPGSDSSKAAAQPEPPIKTISVYTVEGPPLQVLNAARDRTTNRPVVDHLDIQTTVPDQLVQRCRGDVDLLFPASKLSESAWKRCEKNQFKPLEFTLGKGREQTGDLSIYANESSLERRGVRTYLTSVLKVTRGDSVATFGYDPVPDEVYARNRGQIRFYR